MATCLAVLRKFEGITLCITIIQGKAKVWMLDHEGNVLINRTHEIPQVALRKVIDFFENREGL